MSVPTPTVTAWTTLERVVGGERSAVSLVRARVDGEEMTGISFFTLDSTGKIDSVLDFWPEPYEPPPGREHLVERW